MLGGEETTWRHRAMQELLKTAQIEKDDFDLATYSADFGLVLTKIRSCRSASGIWP